MHEREAGGSSRVAQGDLSPERSGKVASVPLVDSPVDRDLVCPPWMSDRYLIGDFERYRDFSPTIRPPPLVFSFAETQKQRAILAASDMRGTRRRGCVKKLECCFALWICLVVFVFAGPATRAQNSTAANTAACGKAKVTLTNPEYLTTPQGIVVVEASPTWALDKSRKQPFYFFRRGENYENAKTLMYITVERLEVPFRRAVQNDKESFQEHCHSSRVRDVSKPELLEQGCEATTQMFSCDRKQKPYVDLATKISIGGLLVNVVLSADVATEIDKYREDYEFLLKHLTVVN